MALASPLESRLFRPLPYPLGLAVFLVQIALGIVLFAIFQEYVPHELRTSDAWPGYLLAAYGGARFCCETPTGAVNDRIERKLGILLGFLALLPAIVAMSRAREEAAFLASAVLMGIGSAFLWPAAYAISADLYPPESRGRVIGFLNLAQLLGFGAGALVGAFLVEAQPGALFVIAFAAVAAACCTAAFALPSYRTAGLFRRVQHEARPSVWSILSPQLAALSSLILATSIALAMLVPAIRPFGEHRLHVSFARLTAALIPAVVIGAALYLPAGSFTDRLGRTRPFFAGQLLLISGLLTVAQTTSLPVAAVAAVVVFAGNVLCVPAWNAAVMDLAPATHRGTLIGLSVALSGLGLAIGPALGGAIADLASPQAVFRVAAGISALTGVGVLLYGRAYGRPAWAGQPPLLDSPGEG